jgi:hypothetical protein
MFNKVVEAEQSKSENSGKNSRSLVPSVKIDRGDGSRKKLADS